MKLHLLDATFELFRAYLDVLGTTGVGDAAAILRPVVSYAAGYGHGECSMLGAQCSPDQGPEQSERELLLPLGQALQHAPQVGAQLDVHRR